VSLHDDYDYFKSKDSDVWNRQGLMLAKSLYEFFHREKTIVYRYICRGKQFCFEMEKK
jgi:hypothetical protein